jgi:hypothetical protein
MGGPMYGLLVKLTMVPGKRDEMIAILKESAAGMPGCFSYVVAKRRCRRKCRLGYRSLGQHG